MENYVEHLVKGKKDTKVYMERGVALALPFLCFFIFLLLSLTPFLFLIIFIIPYLVWIRTDKEYEYLYMAGDLSIDTVYHKSSRKRAFSCTKEEVLEIGQYNENRLEGWRREGVLIEDYAGLGENTHYFYLVQKAGKKYALILDCPEKLLKEMRLYSREKGL